MNEVAAALSAAIKASAETSQRYAEGQGGLSPVGSKSLEYAQAAQALAGAMKSYGEVARIYD